MSDIASITHDLHVYLVRGYTYCRIILTNNHKSHQSAMLLMSSVVMIAVAPLFSSNLGDPTVPIGHVRALLLRVMPSPRPIPIAFGSALAAIMSFRFVALLAAMATILCPRRLLRVASPASFLLSRLLRGSNQRCWPPCCPCILDCRSRGRFSRLRWLFPTRCKGCPR